MTRTILLIKALIVGIIHLFVLPANAQPETFTYGSGTDWRVFEEQMDAQGKLISKDLGPAQIVCLTASTPSSPSDCPPGTAFGYESGGWDAQLPDIKNQWMWAPKVSADGPKIDGNTSPAAFAKYTFQRTFMNCGTPTKVSFFIAADDGAQVYLNGTLIPTLTTTGAADLKQAVVTFQPYINEVKIKATNGVNPPNCGGSYKCNPAGVLFEAKVEFPAPAPRCTGMDGKTYAPGQWEPPAQNACPVGGTTSRQCYCGFWGEFSPCSIVQLTNTTCPRTIGLPAPVGTIELLWCQAGQTGSRSRECKADGAWLVSDTCTTPSTPMVQEGEVCGGDGGEIRACAPGTSCQTGNGRGPVQRAPAWCLAMTILGWFIQPAACHPDPPLVGSTMYCTPN